MLRAFVRGGLVKGHKCLAVLGEPDPDSLASWLGSDAEVGRWVDSGQLEVRGAADKIGSPDKVSIDNLLEFSRGWLLAALGSEGYTFARLVVEANRWLPPLSDVAELLEYEARLNASVRGYPTATMGLYDVSCLDGQLVLELARTHQKVLIDGVTQSNLGFQAPDGDG
jgi:hypothetical protein